MLGTVRPCTLQCFTQQHLHTILLLSQWSSESRLLFNEEKEKYNFKTFNPGLPCCLVVKTVSTSQGMGSVPGRRNLTCLVSWHKK